MANFMPSGPPGCSKAMMPPLVDWDRRLEGRDRLAQPHQTDLRAA
jgi:hypothetical protein